MSDLYKSDREALQRRDGLCEPARVSLAKGPILICPQRGHIRKTCTFSNVFGTHVFHTPMLLTGLKKTSVFAIAPVTPKCRLTGCFTW